MDAANSMLDMHAADQILIYPALAKGGSFTTRHISLHARTAMWLIEQFLPVTFTIAEPAGQIHFIVILLRKLP
ncbi:RNA 3'-terminal phosphate cyclase [Nitrosomonas nitrosa]|nr:RNA 3'-terminal phosphate cyclase [Nitrosomonas nitrosa]